MIVKTLRLTAGLAVVACLWGGAAVSGHGTDTAGGPAGSGTRVTAGSALTGAADDGRGNGHGGGGHHGDKPCPVTTAWGSSVCPGKPLN
ncbi:MULTISPECIES: hypothetical protein [unclassified Streptomyces]|uniref:hypothetical protein n=1 Tax=unclassified Streptomyces TaxID=2593676 RepID=UPI0022543D49|nr:MULTISPECIES: hypothetical protein [unclassified Streptomyces]MCX4631036.1 hypothetical protein [Streptomyces sp. NBC_01443]WSW46922.1 hypothetical protein OG296_29590 [Streptomyces sp. NBC_01001]